MNKIFSGNFNVEQFWKPENFIELPVYIIKIQILLIPVCKKCFLFFVKKVTFF